MTEEQIQNEHTEDMCYKMKMFLLCLKQVVCTVKYVGVLAKNTETNLRLV